MTTTDAGGPLEFVTDGVTGLVAAPDPESLGAAMSKYLMAPAETRSRRRFFVFAVAAVLLVAGTMYVRKKNGYVTQQASTAAEFGFGKRVSPETWLAAYSAFSSSSGSFTRSTACPRTE